MIKRDCYYEIRDTKDQAGICGRYDSVEQALEEINRAYRQAKELGFNHTDAEFIIVCVENERHTKDDGSFLKETMERFIVAHAEYSFYDGAFVFAY